MVLELHKSISLQSFPCHNDQFAAQISMIFHSPVEKNQAPQLMNTAGRDSGDTNFVVGESSWGCSHPPFWVLYIFSIKPGPGEAWEFGVVTYERW